MRSTSTSPMPGSTPRRSMTSSPSAIFARSRTTRSRRSRPGSWKRPTTRKRAGSTTSTAARRDSAPMGNPTSAGKAIRGQSPNAISHSKGFTYLWMMFVIAAMGFGLAAIGEFTSHAQQRDKEVELLFVGNQMRQAIAGYYNNTPGIVKVYPQTLDDLLQDKRYPGIKRYLRRVYID